MSTFDPQISNIMSTFFLAAPKYYVNFFKPIQNIMSTLPKIAKYYVNFLKILCQLLKILCQLCPICQNIMSTLFTSQKNQYLK
jgi:hypothetical protein